MADDHTGSKGDRSDQQLTPERAFQLTEKQGMLGKEVAELYDVTPSYVSQLKGQYQNAVDKGRNSAEISDFERDEIKDYLEDTKDTEDEYECPNCTQTFEYMEYQICPNCDSKLPWDKVAQ